MADFNFKSSFYLEEQAAELARRCGFPEDIDTGINWAYVGGEMDMEMTLLIAVLLFVILMSGYLIIYNIFYIHYLNLPKTFQMYIYCPMILIPFCFKYQVLLKSYLVP